MKIYIVGGAVRDRLLGLPVEDRDYVVVGATVDEMLAKGFVLVGRDFPVFLHPQTHQEYALARTERKIAAGYQGFAIHADPSVTLEEDLGRRDLTINAMAEDESGHIIDPYGGQTDLALRVFRHVSDAFAEDPVRILRLARFAARFTNFSVASETEILIADMVRAGEVDALVPERVWQECERGLRAQQPSRMCSILSRCGAMDRIAPAIAAAHPGLEWPALDRAAALGLPAPLRFAVWMWEAAIDAPTLLAQIERWRVPSEFGDAAQIVLRELDGLSALDPQSAEDLLALMERCDVLRRPARLDGLLTVYTAMTEIEGRASALMTNLAYARQAMHAVDAGAIARDGDSKTIPLRLRAARLAAIERALRSA